MANAPSQAVIRIGPAGWSYPDWRGIVYPKRKPRGFHELEYLARFFDAVEINTSFYNPPRPEAVKGWIRQVQHHPSFTFTAKLWQGFTHGRNATPDDERAFKEGIAPLAETGRREHCCCSFPGHSKTIQNIASMLPTFAGSSENTLWSLRSGTARGTSRRSSKCSASWA